MRITERLRWDADGAELFAFGAIEVTLHEVRTILRLGNMRSTWRDGEHGPESRQLPHILAPKVVMAEKQEEQ